MQKLPSLSDLKEFIKDWNSRKGLDIIGLAHGLFEKLYTEEYQGKSFLRRSSEFIENFGNHLDNEFENKCLIVFQKDCDNFLKQLLKRKQERVASKKELNQEEINDFLSPYKSYIYKELLRLKGEGGTGKGQTLLGAFQIIGVKEEFLITDHYFHHIKSFKGVHYLVSPSHVHYLARRKEAIFLYIRVSLNNGEEFIKDLLRDHRPKTNMFYVFTRDCFIPESVLQDCENYRIKLVTTTFRKQSKYAGDPIVITLEKFFGICKNKYLDGKGYPFTEQEREYFDILFWRKFEEFREFPILRDGYGEQIQNNKLEFNNEGKLIT